MTNVRPSLISGVTLPGEHTDGEFSELMNGDAQSGNRVARAILEPGQTEEASLSRRGGLATTE
jgi:hypothetical protein